MCALRPLIKSDTQRVQADHTDALTALHAPRSAEAATRRRSKELLLQLERLRGTVSHNSRDIKVVFKLLKRMQEEENNRALLAQIPKKQPAIGFKRGK